MAVPALAIAERPLLVREQMQALVAGERDLIANVANFSALVLGPLQGQPACIRIAADARGSSGGRRHPFAVYIACDVASNSEIVVPLIQVDGTMLGVWDVNSPVTHRFDEEDRVGMQALCAVFMASLASVRE